MHPTDDVLNEFVEETLGATERTEVEQHLASCASCRAIVGDVREIRSVAKTLDLREPPARAWSRLERAIKLEAEHITQSAQSPQSQFAQRSRRSLREVTAWLAAAAAIVIAVGVGYRVMPHEPTTAAPVASTAPANDAAAAVSVEAELKAAEEHYQKAITGLEQIANAGKGSLDTQTAATLQKNLSVIDQAITESRAAVRLQPTSEPAQQSLLESFKAKLALLQDTVALINEMRKGNDAGAARIGSGLRQKG